MAESQKLKVTQTSTKAQAAGAGSLGVSSLVVAIVQLFQIQMTPEQLAALVTIAGAIAAFGGAWFATNSPIVQDAEQKDAAIPVKPVEVPDEEWLNERERWVYKWMDEVAARRKQREAIAAPDQPLATIPTAVVDPARKAG